MCPHAQTTTVAFLYGESDLAHAAHIAGCQDCERVTVEHAAVVAALGPTLGALRPARPAPSWRIGGLALAAAVLLAVICRSPSPPAIAASDDDPDRALDALELELTSFSWEEP